MKRGLGVVVLLACTLAAPALAAPGPAAQAQQFALAAQPGMKILVNKDGWYRVGFAALKKAGFAIPANKPSLQLYADGVQVPMEVKRTAIEFYGLGLDTLSTDTRAYWLVAGKGASQRIRVAKAGVRGGSPHGSFPYSVDVRQVTRYIASILNGPQGNLFGNPILPGTPATETVTATHAVTSAPGSLRVTIQGLSLKPHSVKVTFNGADLGAITSNGQTLGTATFRVPAGAVKEGDNTVLLNATGGELDVSYFGSLTLTYQHAFTADGDVLGFSVRSGQRVSVGGFSSKQIRVVDVSSPARVRELVPTVTGAAGNYTLTVKAPGGATRLLAFADSKAGSPQLDRNDRSTLNATTNSADMVMLAYHDFIPALKPLVDLRQRQGLKVAVVDVADVFDEFSFGDHSSQAISDFLAWTRTHWQHAPRYVLLVGDASFDPRNFFHFGSFDFVPTKLVDTQYMEAPSDDSLADFNGDGVPEMAVGRLPVRTADQATAVVNKIVGYEARPVKSPRDLLLVADKNIDYDFEAESQTLFGLIPPGVTVSSVYRNTGPTDAAVRSRLLAALNQGPTIVNFFGHGSASIWTSASLLKATDAPSLTNSTSLSLYLMMTCLNGYFIDPSPVGASLGETLLTAPNGGAIATWSSSGLTVPTDQVVADQQAVKLLLTDPTTTLGDAMLKGKAAIRDLDVRHTWTLLGDPATKLH